jgi:hypothetical protein
VGFLFFEYSAREKSFVLVFDGVAPVSPFTAYPFTEFVVDGKNIHYALAKFRYRSSIISELDFVIIFEKNSLTAWSSNTP